MGPMKTAQMLIDALRDVGVAEKRLLDIGGGVGALQHELFKAGVASAVDVDGSSAYIAAAMEEAERQGTRDRVEYHHCDFIDIASGLDEADVVTLAGSFFGVVYPRKSLVSKLAIGGANLFLKIKNRFGRSCMIPSGWMP